MIGNVINNLFQDREINGSSINWANWMSELELTTCKFCVEQHGKIVSIFILDNQFEVQAHPNCKCMYVPMRTKQGGTATDLGFGGADIYLMRYGTLPNFYVTKKDAGKMGWKDYLGNLRAVCPGKSIGGDVYRNIEEKLPTSVGRIWYEADINYSGGYRNSQRILYSNDGLIFVTYDHYQTFYEITQ